MSRGGGGRGGGGGSGGSKPVAADEPPGRRVGVAAVAEPIRKAVARTKAAIKSVLTEFPGLIVPIKRAGACGWYGFEIITPRTGR